MARSGTLADAVGVGECVAVLAGKWHQSQLYKSEECANHPIRRNQAARTGAAVAVHQQKRVCRAQQQFELSIPSSGSSVAHTGSPFRNYLQENRFWEGNCLLNWTAGVGYVFP